MSLTKLELQPLPTKPTRCGEIKLAWRNLEGAHKSVSHLFDALFIVRTQELETKSKSAQGRLSADHQDLLRAALIFTSSGLDACLKQLLHDALPVLIAGSGTAALKFSDFVKGQLYGPRPTEEFRDAVLHPKPRGQLVDLYVAQLTKASFQGSGDLKSRARDVLGITNAQVSTAKINKLDAFFTARNEIVHDLDYVESTGPGIPARRTREQQHVQDQCDEVLQLLAELLIATTVVLKACRAR